MMVAQYRAADFLYAIPNVEIPEEDVELMYIGDKCEEGLQFTKHEAATIW
jgi:hypothetical protein